MCSKFPKNLGQWREHLFPPIKFNFNSISRISLRLKVWLIDCKLEKELPTLQEIVSHQWSKTAELDSLKKECAELQRKIDESLKTVENGETSEHPKPNMPDDIAA